MRDGKNYAHLKSILDLKDDLGKEDSDILLQMVLAGEETLSEEQLLGITAS